MRNLKGRIGENASEWEMLYSPEDCETFSVSAAAHKAEGKVLPGESLEKEMLHLKKLQVTKPVGRDIYITKELPPQKESSLNYSVYLSLRSRSKISNYALRRLG